MANTVLVALPDLCLKVIIYNRQGRVLYGDVCYLCVFPCGGPPTCGHRKESIVLHKGRREGLMDSLNVVLRNLDIYVRKKHLTFFCLMRTF